MKLPAPVDRRGTSARPVSRPWVRPGLQPSGRRADEYSLSVHQGRPAKRCCHTALKLISTAHARSISSADPNDEAVLRAPRYFDNARNTAGSPTQAHLSFMHPRSVHDGVRRWVRVETTMIMNLTGTRCHPRWGVQHSGGSLCPAVREPLAPCMRASKRGARASNG